MTLTDYEKDWYMRGVEVNLRYIQSCIEDTERLLEMIK